MLPQPMSKPTPEMLICFSGDHPADRLGIAEVAVGTDHPGNDAADRHAVAHLRNSRRIALAENLERRGFVLLCLCRDGGDLHCRVGLLACHMLGSRRVTERAPGRHRSLARPIAAAVRIEACGDHQFAGALLVGVCSAGHDTFASARLLIGRLPMSESHPLLTGRRPSLKAFCQNRYE
jgi:hypothetical protein